MSFRESPDSEKSYTLRQTFRKIRIHGGQCMFRRILVPVDGTPGSEKAISYARDLALAVDAQVIVCHVVTTPAAASASSQATNAGQYVAKIAQRFRGAGVVTKTQVRRGDPALEIEKTAVEWNVDVVVMATRSRRRLQKLVLGSVADVIVRDSRLPVLLVSTRGRAAQAIRAA